MTDNGADLLDELHAAFTRYVVFPSDEAADATVLWTAASHVQPAWEHAPRLVASSPEKRCGKSRLMDIVAETCHKPLITVNATIAAVVRSIGDDPPTLLVDEADTIFGTKKQAENNEDLRGLLNAGHQRNRTMLRCVGPTQIPTEFPTFSMAMLASIGDLPDTIMDRAVVIRMRRRAAGERVDPYRTRRDSPPLHELRDRLAAWAHAHRKELEQAAPEMPVEDREADTWEPLIAIADLTGGDWPDRAWKATESLTGAERDQDADGSLGLLLLADLRAIFKTADKLDTKTILDRLYELEEAPWTDLRGKPLNDRGLSWRLKPYGVGPQTIRIGETTPRGYYRADFHDVWARYLPPVRNEHNEHNNAGQAVSDESVLWIDPKHETDRNALTSTVAHVAAVADTRDERATEQQQWQCDGCGTRRTTSVNLADFRHPDCGGRFQAGTA